MQLLVDASRFPGPALFQGLGLIAVSVFFIVRCWVDSMPPDNRTQKELEEQRKRDADMAEYNRKQAARKT